MPSLVSAESGIAPRGIGQPVCYVCPSLVPSHCPRPHRLVEALQLHLAAILELEVLARDRLTHHVRDEDAVGLCPGLQPLRDHDRCPVQVVVLDDWLSCVDADAQPDRYI